MFVHSRRAADPSAFTQRAILLIVLTPRILLTWALRQITETLTILDINIQPSYHAEVNIKFRYDKKIHFSGLYSLILFDLSTVFNVQVSLSFLFFCCQSEGVLKLVYNLFCPELQMMHSIWHCRLSTFLIHSSSSHSFKNAGHFSAQCTRNMHAQNALCICSADCTLQNPSLVLKTQNITW